MADEIRYCQALLFAETRVDPAEFCDNEALPDSDYCEDHQNADPDNEPEYEPDDRDYDWPDEHNHDL